MSWCWYAKKSTPGFNIHTMQNILIFFLKEGEVGVDLSFQVVSDRMRGNASSCATCSQQMGAQGSGRFS